MSATKIEPTKRPEEKYGPVHAGVGIAVWLNQVASEGDEGTRFFRTVSIAPRRYRDPKTGEWMDSASFRAILLPALILALEAAHTDMANTPLPGEPVSKTRGGCPRTGSTWRRSCR